MVDVPEVVTAVLFFFSTPGYLGFLELHHNFKTSSMFKDLVSQDLHSSNMGCGKLLLPTMKRNQHAVRVSCPKKKHKMNSFQPEEPKIRRSIKLHP